MNHVVCPGAILNIGRCLPEYRPVYFVMALYPDDCQFERPTWEFPARVSPHDDTDPYPKYVDAVDAADHAVQHGRAWAACVVAAGQPVPRRGEPRVPGGDVTMVVAYAVHAPSIASQFATPRFPGVKGILEAIGGLYSDPPTPPHLPDVSTDPMKSEDYEETPDSLPADDGPGYGVRVG